MHDGNYLALKVHHSIRHWLQYYQFAQITA